MEDKLNSDFAGVLLQLYQNHISAEQTRNIEQQFRRFMKLKKYDLCEKYLSQLRTFLIID